MNSERTKELRLHFGDEALLGWCSKYGHEPIYPATAAMQIKRELIVALMDAGLSAKEVVDELQVSPSHVYNTWNRWLDGHPL